MANVKLKVSTDTMKSKAQEIKDQITQIETNWNKMSSTITNSKSYWEGDASDYHRKFLKENKDDVEKIIKRLKEHPTDLLKMAGIYEQTEKEAKQLANALPKDVII